MSLWTSIDEEAGKPKNLSASDKAKLVAISPKEAAANGLTAGWNLKTVGTGRREGRVTYEPLVAMGSVTGDNDNITPEILLAVLNGSATLLVDQPHTITVVGTINPPVSPYELGFLWQVSTDDGVTWATAPGVSNSDDYTATHSTAGEYKYRCMVSSNKADTEISPIATMVVVAP